MSSAIFVGGTKNSFSEKSLYDRFSTFGKVKSVKLGKYTRRGRHQNRNNGYCIITFESPEAAQKVLEQESVEIEGRVVTCRQFMTGKRLARAKKSKVKRMLHVANLPFDVTDQILEEYFGKFGEIESAYTLKRGESRLSKGFGHVIFKNTTDCHKVLQEASEGLTLGGRSLRITRYLKNVDQRAAQLDHQHRDRIESVTQDRRQAERRQKRLREPPLFNFEARANARVSSLFGSSELEDRDRDWDLRQKRNRQMWSMYETECEADRWLKEYHQLRPTSGRYHRYRLRLFGKIESVPTNLEFNRDETPEE